MVMTVTGKRGIEVDYIKAFLVGGAICATVQILLDKTKLLPGRIMVLLVCTGAVLGFLGLYEPFSQWAGAGATVPLSGFGFLLAKGVEKAIAEQGARGILTGAFTAASGGVTAAILCGLIASFITRPKEK